MAEPKYVVKKDGKFLSGNFNARTGGNKMDFTPSVEHAYTFDQTRAKQAAEHYGGEPEEYHHVPWVRQGMRKGFVARKNPFAMRMWR